jgi:hypothetical protein
MDMLWQLLAGDSEIENCKLEITQISSQGRTKYPAEDEITQISAEE